MKKLKILSIIVSLALVLSSCTMDIINKNEETKDNKNIIIDDKYDVMDQGPVKGGVLKLFTTKPDTLNPILTNNKYVHDLLGLVNEGMVKLGRDQKPEKALADNWEVSPDGLIWTFHIRKNAVWQNNMPVTAEDVKFSLETIQNSKANSIYKANAQNITMFTTMGKYDFRIFLKKPCSFTPELMTFPIISKYYFMNDDVFKLDSAKNMQPMGTGPYKFVKSNETGIIKLVENDKWWGLKEDTGDDSDKSLYIGEINIRIFGSNKDEIGALQTNDIDIASIESDEFSKYSARPDLTLKKYISKNYEFIALNLSNPILSDKAVRQAIAYSINRTKIISDVLSGQGLAAEIPVMPNTWLYDTNIITFGYDIVKAKNILIQNGWTEDKNGLYKKIKGVRRYLNLELSVDDYNAARLKVAEMVSLQLKEIGININIKKVNMEDQLKQIKSKKYDMAMLGWSISSVPDISFAYSSLEAAGGFNVSGYKNPTVDSYLAEINSESDDERKKALFTAMKTIIMDDMPYIGLYFRDYAALFSKRIKGEIEPCIWDKYYGISKWYIAKGYQK